MSQSLGSLLHRAVGSLVMVLLVVVGGLAAAGPAAALPMPPSLDRLAVDGLVIPVDMPVGPVVTASVHRYDHWSTLARGVGSGASSSPIRDVSAPRAVTAARACSFTATTGIVLADGATKHISDVEVGDMVLAADPETGETAPRPVTHRFVHQDTVIDLVVEGGAVVTTTEDHPFWNVTHGEFQPAADLQPGDQILTATGDTLTVESLDWTTARTATAYNLAVHDIHTYYVTIGDDTALVHNTCGNPLTDIPDNAQVRVLRPDPHGGAQYGVEHTWRNDAGQRVRFRAHGPDGTAPSGSNAAIGDTYRVQVGGRYLDDAGTLQPRGVHNPRSPNHDPAAANATHMPFNMCIPNPFTGGCV